MQDHAEAPIVDGDAAAVVPPQAPDPVLIEQVDAAVLGDPLEDSPEAQPERSIEPVDFPSFYIRHRSSLAVHARRFLSESHDVEDVVQETFIKLFLAIPEIETELQALAFSRRVITNLCIDRYRAAKRRPNLVNLDTVVGGASFSADEETDPVVQAEDAAVVRHALAMLSPIHRAALVKREIEEKPLPVIAAELGVSDESVKHLLFRARRALRRLLVGTTVDPDAPLPLSELAAAAQARLGRAVSSSALTIVVVLAVIAAAFVAGVGLRGSSHSPERVAGSTPTIGSLLPAPENSTPKAHKPVAHHHHFTPATTNTAHQPGSASDSTTATPLKSHPTKNASGHRPPPAKHPKPPVKGQGPPAAVTAAPHLRFSGDLPLVPGQQPVIATTQTTTSAAGQELVSQFLAPTQQGNLVLGQDATTDPVSDGAPSIALTAQYPVAGQTVSTTTFASSSGGVTLQSGNLAYRGTLDVAVPTTPVPAYAGGATMTAHIEMAMVINPLTSSVVSESVAVTSSTSGATAPSEDAPTTSAQDPSGPDTPAERVTASDIRAARL